MERMAEEVVSKLLELQGTRTDVEMGRLLGVSRSHWCHIKAGRRQLTYALIQRAIKAFPGVWPAVVNDLNAEAIA